MQAVRLRPNVVVPDIDVGEDRMIVVDPEQATRHKVNALARKLAAVQRVLGLDEWKVRARLRVDARFADVADAAFPQPRTSLTPGEAALLVERGLADPVSYPPSGPETAPT
jgi:hypothetical protein